MVHRLKSRRGGYRPGSGRKPAGFRRPGDTPCAGCGRSYEAVSTRLDGWVPIRCTPCQDTPQPAPNPTVALAIELLGKLAKEPHVPADYRAVARRHLSHLKVSAQDTSFATTKT